MREDDIRCNKYFLYKHRTPPVQTASALITVNRSLIGAGRQMHLIVRSAGAVRVPREYLDERYLEDVSDAKRRLQSGGVLPGLDGGDRLAGNPDALPQFGLRHLSVQKPEDPNAIGYRSSHQACLR